MLYITLLDQFHPGIYKSQVIDVCKYLSSKSGSDLKLLPFLSIREIQRSDNHKQIKELYGRSQVLPAFPGLGNYRLTAWFLALHNLLSGERAVIARNAFAATVSLRLRNIGLVKRLVIDVRSSLTAEIHEYDSFPNPQLRKEIKKTEEEAILGADFRIAVSEAMVQHWRDEYGYSDNKHVVIPCTLNRSVFEKHELKEHAIAERRIELGYAEDDIILIFSGSSAPWQGKVLKEQVLDHYLQKEKHHLIFLSKPNELIDRLSQAHPGRVKRFWLSHEEVPDFLQIGDYGMLLREQSVTNKVASPAKFAEYLAAGLKVLISHNLGDFSNLVKAENLGFLVKENEELPSLSSVTFEEKKRLNTLALNQFSKEYHDKEYNAILEALK